ncbi:exodeoxyribonuclease-like [Lycorma delicatula]|uniref:exodeoxyribonuclease-like n=1 Tax=Lycorma delicatula TaxID=130591 RepID=UPI003F50E359
MNVLFLCFYLGFVICVLQNITNFYTRAETSEQSSEVDKHEVPIITVNSLTNFSTINFNKCDRTTKDGKRYNLKISSWCINGIACALQRSFKGFLKHENPDIFGIQQMRCKPFRIPRELNKIYGYYTFFLSGNQSGGGVGLFSKEKPIKVEYGVNDTEYDKTGRIITAEYEKFYFLTVSSYKPHRDLMDLSKRLKWDSLLKNHMIKLDKIKPVILSGGLHIAHKNRDLTLCYKNKRYPGFTNEERDSFSSLLESGFVDIFRKLYPKREGAYTFWNHVKNCRGFNVGWRRDLFVVSKRLTKHVCDNIIRSEIYGSKHCPLTLFLNI